MVIRKIWFSLSLLLLAVVAVSLYLLQTQSPKESLKRDKRVESLPKSAGEGLPKSAVKAPVDESSQGGEVPGDARDAEQSDTPEIPNKGGEVPVEESHAELPAPPEVPNENIAASPAVSASREYTAAVVDIPEGITEPAVLAAWHRVEYIANNIWEWGGVPNPETPSLIAQLMPSPDGFSGPTGHSDMEETFDLLGSLDTNDPRSIVVMATYLCEGLVGGLSPINMLAEMGVAAVPYLIPYMLDMGAKPYERRYPIEVLGRIAARHRAELGGIVEHILIPRWEAVLAQEKPNYDEEIAARGALARLK